MKTKFLSVIMLGALFMTAGAVAQEKEKMHDGKGKGDVFKKLDADNDGKLSMAEVEKAPKGKLKEHFAAIDTNKDSFIDKEEMKAYRQQKREKMKDKPNKQK